MALSEETKRKLNEARSTTLGGGEASRPSSLSDDTKAKLDAAKGDLFTKSPEQTERENAVSFSNQFGELKKRYEQQRNLTEMRESLGLPDVNALSPEERKQAQQTGEYMRGQQASQVIEDFAEKHPVTGTIMGSIGSLGGATEYFKALKEGMQGGRYTGYDSYNGGSVIVPSPTRISQAATSGATKATAKNLANVVRTVNNTIPFFETDEEAEVWGSKLGEDVQSVITSQIQSLAVGSTLGKYGALLLGGSAASSAYLEAIDRGDSVRNALLHGAASGVAEAAAEYLPLDNLTKIMRGGKKPLVQTLTSLFRQTVTEGLEEGATDLASTIADSLIYMTPEELDKAVAVELASGKGNAKAYADALSDIVFKGLSDIDLAEVGRDMALGAVGGLLGGGVATIGSRIATNVADTSTGAALRRSGVTSQNLANAAKATGAEAKTAEKMSKRQMGKAYREISNANTRTAIEVRLAQNGVSDPSAVADIITKAVRDEESLTGEERRTLENPGVSQVLKEVREYASEPSDSSWLASAEQATNFAVRVGVNQQENKGLIESLQRITDEGSTLDSATQEFRAEEMAVTADEVGISAQDIAEAYGKRENEGISLERYATVLKMAYAYGRSARTLQEWAAAAGLSTDDAVTKAYENGQKAYLEKGRGEIARAKASSAKVKYMSQTSLDRINPKFSAVDVKSMNSAQRAFAAFLNKVVAPRIHRTIYLFDGADVKTNGWNDSTGIYININAKNGTRTFDMLGTFLHEFGHEIRIESPELFAELTQIVVDNWYKGDRGSFDAAVQAKIAARKETVDKYGEGEYIDEPQAVEEIVCESLSKLAEHPEDVQKIFTGHETLAQRALTFLKKILDAVKKAVASIAGESNMYAEMMDTEALEKAVDVLSRYVEQVNQKVNQTTETVETELAESGIEFDSKTGTAMFSTQDIPHTEEEINVAVERLAKALNVSEADARRWVESELSAASLVLDPKFNGMDAAGVNYLDYESDRRLGAIKKNSDYPQGTLDFSNICRKRVEYTKMMQRLQKQFPNRVFTAEELAEIREILIRNDIEVACGLCFVEDRRQNETGIAKLFQEAMTSWFAGERETFNAGQTKALQMLNGGESIPSIYELTTLDGMRDLRAKAPNVADAWETFNNARGMQSARLLQREAEYKRQILKFNSARVKAINNVGGLRIYSFSDFQEFHLLDILQAIQDCAAMGIKIQAYTKVPSFAKLVKDTGVKINRSLIPLGRLGYHMENGKVVLDYDLREGIDIKDKNFFDSIDNPNVGNVLVGINNEQISAAMLDPFVDYIIPFHTGQKSDVLAIKKIAEWENYKNYQTDKPLPGTKRTKMINIYTEVLQAAEKEGKPITNKVEFVNKFLEVCKKEGMKPRFWQFLNVDENGDYTYREGYHKFLVDFKMFDADGNILPQEKVIPNFDNEFVTELLSEYVNSQAEKQASLAPKLNKAYAEIEKKVINKSFSTQDEETAPTFYSQMGKVIEQQKANKFDARSLINMLLGKGVKAEEIKWSGIAAWLDGKKSVTKEELQEFVRGSMLQVEDEWLTNRNWDSNNWEDYDAAESYTYTEARTIIDEMVQFDELKDGTAAQRSLHVDYEDDIFYAYAKIDGEEKMILKYNPRERATRWAQYTLPYTDNYRELKLKMPNADYSNKAMEAHWRESGVLAHARVGDVFKEAEPVTDPETGEVHPIFFIEEIQSDWHNAGSRNGYASPENIKKRRDGVQKLEDLYAIVKDGLDKFDEDEFTKNVNDILTEIKSPLRLENTLGFELYDEGLYRGSAFSEKRALRSVINALNGEELAPDAPFKNGKYIEFVMKKLLRTAAEEGYHKIGWTTAKQQSERWSDSYAEGYRIEYDQDIPKFLNKYGKQWGAKASQETLRNGDVIWTFPITEAMRNSVVYEGQPMYSTQDDDTAKITDERLSYIIKDSSAGQRADYARAWITSISPADFLSLTLSERRQNRAAFDAFPGEYGSTVNDRDFAQDLKNNIREMPYLSVSADTGEVLGHEGRHRLRALEKRGIKSVPILVQFYNSDGYLIKEKNGYGNALSPIGSLIVRNQYGTEQTSELANIIPVNRLYEDEIRRAYGSGSANENTLMYSTQDEEYLELAKDPKKNKKKLRAMVDEAAKAAFPNSKLISGGEFRKMWHFTTAQFNSFKPGRSADPHGIKGMFFAPTNNGSISSRLGDGKEYYLNVTNPKVPGAKEHNKYADQLRKMQEGITDAKEVERINRQFIKETGVDGFVDWMNGWYTVLTPEQIKSADLVTYDDDGNVIPLSQRFNPQSADVRFSTQDEEIPIQEGASPIGEGEYSIRDDMDTRNIIASILLDQIHNQEDKETLRRYLETSNIQRAALDRRDELIEMLRTPGVATAEQLAEAKKELASIRKAIQTREQALNEIETQPRIQTLIRNQYDTIKEYERLVAEEREENQQRIRELRAKMNEKVRAEIDKRIEMRRDLMAKARQQRANDYYIPRIEKAFADMRKNLEKAPEAFRAPFYAFMAAIDFRSLDKDGNVRMTRNEKVGGQKTAVPNEANIRKTELMAALDELAHGDPVKGTRPWYEAYDIIASEDILDWIEDTRTALRKVVALMSGDVIDSNVHSATSDLLKNIYQLARMFNSTIKHLSKAYTNANLDISDIAKQFSKHANELGTRKNNKVGRVEKFMRYDNAQPITVFDRLGDAGQTLFNLLTKGQSKYAFNYQEILDYAKDWDKKTLRKWTKDVVKVKFGNEEVEMTPAQMISLYLTAKNEDGRRHLLEGGFKLGERRLAREKFKTAYHTIVDATRQITEADIQNLIDTMNQYSPELISMAENVSTFLNTTAKRWANQISIARYGYEQFTVPNYFPLFSIKGDTVGDIDKFRAKGDMPGSFYGFLNRSFTKERQVNADDALVINDVFDVFTDYVGNVALYNAFALPVLDVARFLGYSERNEEGNIAWSVSEKLNAAYGQGVMRSYIEGLLDSINGQQYMTNAESLGLTALRIRNRVAVAANFRVALQQPFSIVRAVDVISPKYFRPFKFDETRREMKKYSGIAVWKHQNNYDADIKMPLKNELIGANTAYGEFVRSATDWGMKAAEFGDEMTWAAIWNACKNYVNETSPGLEGQKYFDAVDAKFNEVIYRTQVVDSVLQKSQVMREKNFFAKMISAFKSEPTTSYNMLLRQYDRLVEAKQAGNTQAVWNTVRGPMLRSFVVFALNGIVNALVTALVDAMRDDDDYETMTEKMREAFFGEYSGSSKGWQQFLRSNLFEGINPLGIPYLADALSLLQGYEPDRVDLIAVEGALNMPATIERLFQTPTFKDAFKVLDAASKISGLPMSNMMRDVVSIWNSTFGTIDHNLKMQTSPESAKSGYEALYKAMTEGKDVRAAQLVDEINDNIGDSSKAYQGVTGIMRDAYKKGDLTRDEARKYLSMAGDYFEIDRTEKQIESRIDDWDEQKQS